MGCRVPRPLCCSLYRAVYCLRLRRAPETLPTAQTSQAFAGSTTAPGSLCSHQGGPYQEFTAAQPGWSRLSGPMPRLSSTTSRRVRSEVLGATLHADQRRPACERSQKAPPCGKDPNDHPGRGGDRGSHQGCERQAAGSRVGREGRGGPVVAHPGSVGLDGSTYACGAFRGCPFVREWLGSSGASSARCAGNTLRDTASDTRRRTVAERAGMLGLASPGERAPIAAD